MKYTIHDKVTRFVKRFGMIMDPETMAKAKEEDKEYDVRLISPGHHAIRHKDNLYVIIERDGLIGCSCDDMIFNRLKGDVCKHIIKISRLMSPITKEIDKLDAAHLMNVCGWTGRELHPEEIQIPPDPDLDLGVGDPLPEEPERHFVKCQYCKMMYDGQTQEKAAAWLKAHESGCQKNPANSSEKPNGSKPKSRMMTAECRWCGKKFERTNAVNLQAVVKDHEEYCEKKPELGEPGAVVQESCKPEPKEEETKMSKDTQAAWDTDAWNGATQGNFAAYDENGIAEVIFTANDFEIGKPDKWGRTPYEFSVIQNNKSVVLSVASIRLMHALKQMLPLEGKRINIIRTGSGMDTKYEVQEVAI